MFALSRHYDSIITVGQPLKWYLEHLKTCKLSYRSEPTNVEVPSIF